MTGAVSGALTGAVTGGVTGRAGPVWVYPAVMGYACEAASMVVRAAEPPALKV
ncbi:hypothetical protein GCM10023220_03670 [Streptomyces ziwulingensis]|uniref:Uncharacterized protein n=1 Tax=Streptomyces ziwulingensis TaxID=1045501 RepID=A0ABP9ANN3_9ACTN